MSDADTPHINESDSNKSAGGSTRSIKRHAALPVIIILSTFFVALGLRTVHNLSLAHQVWLMNDAYNYMYTGKLLLNTVQEPGKLKQIFCGSSVSASNVPDHLKLTSRQLGDRISLDGVLYPSYLAFVQGISGSVRETPIEDCRVPVCMTNSLIDALSCVFICLAAMTVFGTAVGAVAGFIAATYPSFVVNTQQCLSEPLACFFVSLWLLRFSKVLCFGARSIWIDMASYALLGCATAFVIMIKPAHTLLVGSGLIVWIGLCCAKAAFVKPGGDLQPSLKSRGVLLSRKLILWAVAVVTAAIVLIPFTVFSKKLTGDWMLSARRSPYESLALTFNASQDGWRAYPYPGSFPTSAAEMLERVKKSIIEGDQAQLILISIKKISRLWGGVANDFGYPILGCGYDAQVFFHRLLLIFGFVGFLILWVRTKSIFASRRAIFGCLLLFVMCFHCSYLLFEAMPRYAMTALPCVIILAAYGLVSAYRTAISPAYFFVPTALICTLVAFVQASANQAASIASLLSVNLIGLAPWCLGLFQALMIIVVLRFCVPLLVAGPLSARRTLAFLTSSTKDEIAPPIEWACLIAAASVSVVLIVCCVANRNWSEWKCELSGERAIKQTIAISSSASPLRGAMLLIDCESSALPPPIEAQLNGKTILDEAVPFAEVAAVDSGIVNGLMRTEFAMGNDSRSFRQWWAIPVSPDLLKFGANNEIMLKSAKGSTVTVFGCFDEPRRSENYTSVPSLWRFSHTKGYCSTERGDSRIVEMEPVRGSAISSLFHDGTWSNADLSSAFGTQRGAYRVRIMTISAKSEQLQSSNKCDGASREISLIPRDLSVVVDARDPKSMFPIHRTVQLPSDLKAGTRFSFSCEIRSLSHAADANVSLSFGAEPAWTSPWQPLSFPINAEWKRLTFADVIPESAFNREVRLMVSPYQPDLIYTNRKRALKSRIEIRGASLRILAPTGLGRVRAHETQLF